MTRHLVQFYEGDAFLLDNVARFVGDSLAEGNAGVVIATASHRRALDGRLRALGLDLRRARDEGRYVTLDAAETVARFLDGVHIDETRFTAVVGGVVRDATRGGEQSVHAFGEMVAVLCAEGKSEAAFRLEELWNELARTLSFSLLCAYPIGGFRDEASTEHFLRICAEHSHIVPAESYSALPDREARLRKVVELQQRASMLGPLEAEHRDAEETRARLAAIVESSDDAIVGKTLEGIVTSWNRSAERLFGYTADEMIGQPISRLIPSDRRDDFARILGSIRRGERVDHFETVRVTKDGKRIHVSLTVSPVRDSRGRIVGASKIARDVSDRKRAEAEREELLRMAQRARAEAETASRAKDEFLAMLGHELRNPLSAVRNAVASARLDERHRERALEIARRQTDHLARLVDDLLDVARITHGRIVLRREHVYLPEIIERAVETTRALVEDRGHTLSVSLPPDDILLDGDPTRLEQIIVNLLSNAAKYTDRGGHIEVVAQREGGDAVLRVRDDGVGIAGEMLPRVFDLFAQGKNALDRPQGGLGVGLTVVRRLTELHGGRVEAHSDGPGRGAEFVVLLPAVPPEGTPRDLATSARSGRAHGRARVLVVEDNPDAAESLGMLLELLGHDARVVHDGPRAIEVAPASPPDVMLIDIGLPGMDGYEVARRIRRHPELGGVLLVALTGYGRDEDRRRAVEAGFDHHLVKPIDPKALQEIVERFVPSEPRAEKP